MNTNRINLENLSQQAADSIAERIIRKELVPGERLVESKIAHELGVSQGTIREAFRILEKKKMVTIMPRRGTTVTQLNADYVDSLFDILTELYSLLMKKTMKKMTPSDIEDLSLVIDNIRKCKEEEDVQKYHDSLFDALSLFMRVANDPLLEHTIKDLWQVTRWIQYEELYYKKKENLADYYELDVLDLTLKGDVRAVVRKIREDTQHAKEMALKAIANADREITDSRQ